MIEKQKKYIYSYRGTELKEEGENLKSCLGFYNKSPFATPPLKRYEIFYLRSKINSYNNSYKFKLLYNI